MLVLFIVVCIAAIFGLLLVKNDELAAIGEPAHFSKARFAHGKLVKATPKQNIPEARNALQDYLRSIPWVSSLVLVMVIILAVAAGWLDIAQWLAASALCALIVPIEATLRCPVSKPTLTRYLISLVASTAIAMVLTTCASFVAGTVFTLGIAYGILSIVGYMVGSAFIAFVPLKVEFEREFADGAKRSISVSVNSRAYKYFMKLQEESNE